MASFFYEFEFLEDIEVPNGAVEIINSKGLIVFSKSSIFFETQHPRRVLKGERVRFRQDIKLDIAAGDYTFTIVLGAMSWKDYLNRSTFPYPELDPKLIRLNTMVNVGVFTVTLPYRGGPIQLLHHGIANLPSDCVVKLIEKE